MIMIIPLIILAVGAIFSGFLFKELFIGADSSISFWNGSIFFLQPLSIDHPPFWFIYITPILVTSSIPLAYYFFIKNKEITKDIVSGNLPLYNFLKNKWYFDEIYEYLFVKPSKKIGLYFWKKIDLRFIDRFGPDGISSLIKIISSITVKFQNGFIYHYAFVMLLGFSALLTFLILK